jgi:hypothetical protein
MPLVEFTSMFRIPGNGIVGPGNGLFGKPILMGFIPPEPEKGKKQTLDYLLREHIEHHVSDPSQKEAVQKMIEKYEGLEPDVIFLLSYALQDRKFDITVEQLEQYANQDLKRSRIPTVMRCTSQRNCDFFCGLYESVHASKYQ